MLNDDHCPLCLNCLIWHTKKRRKIVYFSSLLLCSWFFALPQSGLLIYWKEKSNVVREKTKKVSINRNRAGKKFFFREKMCKNYVMLASNEEGKRQPRENRNINFSQFLPHKQGALVSLLLLALSGTLTEPEQPHQHKFTTLLSSFFFRCRKNIWKNFIQKKNV